MHTDLCPMVTVFCKQKQKLGCKLNDNGFTLKNLLEY